MRIGGGQAKGSAFERQTGKELSLWLTGGERGDIMSRNVLSGGRFTLMTAAGKVSSHMPGDLMAASPLGFAFLSKYAVECKHHRTMPLLQYLVDPKAGGELGKIIALARKQASAIGLEFLVVFKQNRVEPLAFASEKTGYLIMESLWKEDASPMHHRFHGGRVFCMRWRDLVTMVDPNRFLGE